MFFVGDAARRKESLMSSDPPTAGIYAPAPLLVSEERMQKDLSYTGRHLLDPDRHAENTAMKALFLTKYSALAPSTRYRSLQYFPYLKAQGWDITWQPFLSDHYLTRLYQNRDRSITDAIKALLGRIHFLSSHNLHEFDVICVEHEVLPRMPFWFESLIFKERRKLVLDYDDAVFIPRQGSVHMENKIGKLIGWAAEVIVGNDYLRSYASQFTTHLTLIPTVIDLKRYSPRDSYEWPGNCFVIGWIGTPSTVHHLAEFAPVLAKLSLTFPIVMRCVGVPSGFRLPGVRVEALPWSEETEAQIIRTFDVGVMPLSDEPFAQGKCGLKLIQYMGCGVPAVGQSLGANKTIIRDGINGYLASSNDEYIEKITALIAERSLRERLGRAGRRTIEERYALEVAAGAFSGVLKKVAEVSPRAGRAVASCQT